MIKENGVYIDRKIRVRTVKKPRNLSVSRSMPVPKKGRENNEHVPQKAPNGTTKTSTNRTGGRRKAYASTKGHTIN